MNLAPLTTAFDKRTRSASQRAALDALVADGFPTRRDELWKYTRSEPLAEFALRALSVSPSSAADKQNTTEEINTLLAPYGDVGVLAFVDGMLDARLTRLPEGVSLNADESNETVSETGPAQALGLLNQAFPSAAIALAVAQDADVSRPLHIVHRVTGPDALSQVRLSIRLAANARLTVIEHFDDTAEHAQMHNTVLNAHVGRAAQLRLRRMQSLHQSALQVTRIDAAIEADASLDTLTLDIGAALVRNDLNVKLLGEDASVTMRGIYLGNGKQHIDNHTRVDHVAKNTTSVEDYRGILRDSCRCVFNGKVMVHEGADGTDAAQSNPNLLLSDNAEIDTKPELEIYADDVKCSHGATVGQIDEKSLFYLRSRGIDEPTAVQLLTYAFCREALVAIDSDALRMQMERMVAEQIPDFSALELIT